MTVPFLQRLPFAVAIVALFSACSVGTNSPASSPSLRASNSDEQVFKFTGAHQTFVVPAGITRLSVQADGASGGLAKWGPKDARVGFGGSVAAVISVASGETLEIIVGGRGKTLDGGYNGGGRGAQDSDGSFGGGGGGGASEVLEAGNRVIVAGGGGGNADVFDVKALYGIGGDGGRNGARGANGFNSSASYGDGGEGATQTAPGRGGDGGSTRIDGTEGKSGSGGSNGSGGSGGQRGMPVRGCDGNGGGGGGGYYGGGGGGGGGPANNDPIARTCPGAGGGGGGGSSFAEPTAIGAFYFKGTNSGDGRVIVSW